MPDRRLGVFVGARGTVHEYLGASSSARRKSQFERLFNDNARGVTQFVHCPGAIL